MHPRPSETRPPRTSPESQARMCPAADPSTLATLRLAIARGVGPATISRLRASIGRDAAIVSASAQRLARCLGIADADAARLEAAIAAADPWIEHRRTLRGNARILGPTQASWPPLLHLLDPGVPALWCRGSPPTGDRTVAIVGARRADEASRQRASDLAAALAGDGWTIVSGGALGIDAAAHRGALRAGGRTIAVLGSGLSRPSPASHRPLFEEIVDGGGTLLSEWPMETEARPGHFPRRNRVIAGLARAVLVIAAGERSGAHITARLAIEELGRDVGAVPGRPEDSLAAGCLRLIREGAGVLRDADDAREILRGTEVLADAARCAARVATTGGGDQFSSASPSARSITIRSCRPRAAEDEPA